MSEETASYTFGVPLLLFFLFCLFLVFLLIEDKWCAWQKRERENEAHALVEALYKQ